MCLLLADFLRETLATGARERIPLAAELDLARRFLSIEQVRFGDRLRVEISADDAGAAAVPPLLLLPRIAVRALYSSACLPGATFVAVYVLVEVATMFSGTIQGMILALGHVAYHVAQAIARPALA